MYSIVMLTAVSAGADVTPAPAPATLVPGGVYVGGTGCCGSVAYGCSGSCTGAYSTYGVAWYGSCHGSCHGHGRGGFLGGRNACHGGGYSCSGYNCFSSGYGCSGSCYGSYIAGYGSCQGCHGVFSYGSTWGPPIGMPPYTLHGYNSGYYADPNAVWGAAPGPNRPPVMTVPVAPMTKPSSDGSPQGANLKFDLPAGAKLFVDGKPTAGTGAERTFYTPPLAAGQKFFYDVKAELTVGGETVVEEKRVVVEAGSTVTESFPKLVAAAGKPTTVAGK